MDEEVRDGEVSLEVPRKVAPLDFGVLRRAESGPCGAQWTRRLRQAASDDADGCILACSREAKMEILVRIL
jgi:hypothetical protein